MFGTERLVNLILTVDTAVNAGRAHALVLFNETKQGLKDISSLLIKIGAGQSALQERIKTLEQHIDRDRREDREFVMSIIALLSAKAPNTMVKLPTHFDPYEELPLNHPAGYTLEQLGITTNDRPQAEV